MVKYCNIIYTLWDDWEVYWVCVQTGSVITESSCFGNGSSVSTWRLCNAEVGQSNPELKWLTWHTNLGWLLRWWLLQTDWIIQNLSVSLSLCLYCSLCLSSFSLSSLSIPPLPPPSVRLKEVGVWGLCMARELLCVPWLWEAHRCPVLHPRQRPLLLCTVLPALY